MVSLPDTYSQVHIFEMHCGSPIEIGCDAAIRSRTAQLQAGFSTVMDKVGQPKFEVAFFLNDIEPLPGVATEANVARGFVPPTKLGKISLTVYFSPKANHQQVQTFSVDADFAIRRAK